MRGKKISTPSPGGSPRERGRSANISCSRHGLDTKLPQPVFIARDEQSRLHVSPPVVLFGGAEGADFVRALEARTMPYRQ